MIATRALMIHAFIDRPYRLLLVGITVLCASIVPAYAEGFSDCSETFYSGIYPEFTNTKLAQDTQPLCFDGFAVMYSARSRTPLWSAEHLTRERVTQAKTIDRQDSFHEESRLPRSARASLEDYSGSGYDRGHLAPNGDMATRSQQYDSFSLANIAPQSPRNNRYIWRNLEEATRDLAEQYGEVYTVTGVAFLGTELTQLDNRVLVPSHFYKVVYIPTLDRAGVYYAPNDESERVEVIDLDELESRIGIDVLPILAGTRRDNALALPLKGGETLDATSSQEETPDWMLFVAALLNWLVNQLSA